MTYVFAYAVLALLAAARGAKFARFTPGPFQARRRSGSTRV